MSMNDNFHPGSRVNRAKARTASTVRDGIDAAGAGAERALNAASSRMSQARDDLAPAVKEGFDQARSWVDANAGRLQDGVQTARNKANGLKKVVTDYTREEPVKAFLLTAVVGVVLIGLISAIARSDD